MIVGGAPYGAVEDAVLAVSGGRIVWIGPRHGAPEFQAVGTVSLGGRWVTPGLIDCHTHLVFGGDRIGEVEASVAWSGARPVEWLLANAPMDGRWTLVHATHMTDAEAAGLACSGATVALCPSTEGNLGDGFFNADAFLGAGGTFGIGSDSHVTANAAEELRWFEYGRRMQARKRTMSGGSGEHVGAGLWLSAARAGSRPTGRRTGEIAVGARCDLVVLDTDHPTLAERAGDLILDSLVFSGSDAISEVWSGGRRIVEGGRHIHRDAISAAYRRAVAELAQ